MTPPRIAVLVSGTGRHLENLAKLSSDPTSTFKVDLVLAISNKPGIQALDRAREANVPHEVIEPQPNESVEAYGARIFTPIRAARADLVVLAGFLKKLWIPKDYKGQVLNIHPSLLPAFGGKGFYGTRVHQAVLNRGCQVTGCTVHLVDDVYDNGPILIQRWCPVKPDDTPETLSARVFAEELLALPTGIQKHLQATTSPSAFEAP